ncbi:NADH:ubiquinone oxidoreductase, Na(+)-translocating, F subunit [Catenovulum agarivorans DS-2]|uniref:NADH:ubiquinone oxidoreductase, Na(+)-translocating, F subunit n=1 Tax=Catenovulum agarivorans DS-2 TaxID=1328313 RepID=W7QJA0_9ALTE|nr:phosphatase PAP2 family protein [Catenovulum agarivorans]EWH08218.1 NADH:ubiquinone oxidoreductase, Na(+)-translocating, F subunit [Catenovulum agarivorans DS-2]
MHADKLKRIITRKDVMLCALCALVFTTYPQLDLMVTNWFYDTTEQTFYLSRHWLVHGLYILFAKPQIVLLPLLMFLALYGYLKYRKKDATKRHKKYVCTFLLVSLIIGPGLIVNELIKNNSVGRARPVHIEQYGGDAQFTPAFVYSGYCQTNCSFVSGHAAVGFYFIGLAWLFRRKDAFYLGLAIGILVSFTRIAKGGHFLSDTVFAFWVVYFTNVLLAYWFRLENPFRQSVQYNQPMITSNAPS